MLKCPRGGEAAGMGAMDDCICWCSRYCCSNGCQSADAALGQAMDSAMDQGGAPAGEAAPMDDVAGANIVDPGMDDAPKDDDDGGLAG